MIRSPVSLVRRLRRCHRGRVGTHQGIIAVTRSQREKSPVMQFTVEYIFVIVKRSYFPLQIWVIGSSLNIN